LSFVIKEVKTDVVVVGGAGAGCRAAIAAADEGVEVVLLDKGTAGRSGATPCALWSIQAPFGERGMDSRDSPEQMFRDMVVGGRYLGDQNIVEVISHTACDRILDLESYGVKFKKTEDGRFYQTPMPGQTYPRSCFIIENGNALSTILAKEASQRRNVWIRNDFLAFHILKRGDRAVGVLGLDVKEGELEAILAKSVVLASGGYTSIWDFSDNPPTMTGDAVAMAYNAGADIVDLEFNQFYGTDVLWPPSVRGTVVLYELLAEPFTDANVYNSEGKPVFPKPLPIRDEAIRIMYREIMEGRGTPHGGLWYDVTKSPKPREEVRRIFEEMTPRHYEFIKNAAGIDLVEEPLEVAPASHYQCGGVYINEKGETTVAGLFACGECAGNYMGANRLAGSALADTQTMGAQAGRHAALAAKKSPEPRVSRRSLEEEGSRACSLFKKKRNPISPQEVKEQIKRVVGRYVAPIRDAQGLKTALNELKRIKSKLIPNMAIPCVAKYNLEWVDALEANLMVETAELTVGSALFRTESRGHHFRLDHPETDDKRWLKHTVVRMKGGKPSYFTRPVIYTRMPPQGA
jgi:fumarate reductase (CoM/CoB) subunit A